MQIGKQTLKKIYSLMSWENKCVSYKSPGTVHFMKYIVDMPLIQIVHKNEKLRLFIIVTFTVKTRK